MFNGFLAFLSKKGEKSQFFFWIFFFLNSNLGHFFLPSQKASEFLQERLELAKPILNGCYSGRTEQERFINYLHDFFLYKEAKKMGLDLSEEMIRMEIEKNKLIKKFPELSNRNLRKFVVISTLSNLLKKLFFNIKYNFKSNTNKTVVGICYELEQNQTNDLTISEKQIEKEFIHRFKLHYLTATKPNQASGYLKDGTYVENVFYNDKTAHLFHGKLGGKTIKLLPFTPLDFDKNVKEKMCFFINAYSNQMKDYEKANKLAKILSTTNSSQETNSAFSDIVSFKSSHPFFTSVPLGKCIVFLNHNNQICIFKAISYENNGFSYKPPEIVNKDSFLNFYSNYWIYHSFYENH